MAAETILLEVVTPKGVAVREHVLEFTAPGVAGEFGVLPGHLPLLAALRTGLVSFVSAEGKRGEGSVGKFVVHHGFCEVVENKALVLTERVAQPTEIDVVNVRSRLKEVDDELDHWQGELTDPKRRELIEEEQWLAAELEAIGDPPPPMVREDTRFLQEHAEAPSEAEMLEGQEPEDSMTAHHGPGSAFPNA